MLYYDRTEVSEGIDVKKASKSKQCKSKHLPLLVIFR